MYNNSVVEPYSVVTVRYSTFENIEQVGMFLVLYDQQLDSNNCYKGRFIAAKITTSSGIVNNGYSLSLKDESMFDKECFATFDMVHTFDKKNLIETIGKLSPNNCYRVYKTYNKIKEEINRQMVDYL